MVLVKACWHRPFLFVEKPQRTTGRVYYGVCKPVLAVLVPLGNTSGDPRFPAVRPFESGRTDAVIEQISTTCLLLYSSREVGEI